MNSKGWIWRGVCIAALSVIAACGSDDDEPAPAAGAVVTTTAGVVRGTAGASARSYLGIPYAAPPVGTLRWKAPAAVTAWTGERAATAFANHCPQGATPFGTASATEDCLYLNVYTPNTAGPHPVMVWIHGGAFYLGQSDNYNPAALVAQGNVVVTINYRLGALGFLAHPALSAEQGGKSGNYGLMDQQAALRWVRDNIAGFGGDKANVTIFGESAGGFSVHSHLAAAGSAGLFHKAIIMSGAYALDGQPTLAASEAVGTALGTGVACPTPQTVECLRGLPVATLLTAQAAAWPSGPIPSVDGTVLATSVKASLAAQTYNKVPVIQGSTRDEWRLFVALDELGRGSALTSANYAAQITTTFPYLAAQAAGLAVGVYPPSAFDGSPSLALGALGTDLLFSCNARVSSKLQKAAGQNVYSYEFNDRTASAAFPGISFAMGAYHTSELQYLFDLPGRPARTAAQQAVADSIVGAWSRFAKSGNPNPVATPDAWPVLGAAESVQSFDATGPTVVPDATFSATHRCTTVWTPGV
jgi:para-nitrobenzyl esterase